MPRRPPKRCALDHAFVAQLSLTTDLGDLFWPDGLDELQLEAAILDEQHHRLSGYTVELSPSALYETGAVFHTIEVTVRQDRKGKGRQGVYLSIGVASAKVPADTATKRLLSWQPDVVFVQSGLAVVRSVTGPLDLVKGDSHSKQKVETTELLFDLGNEHLTLKETPERGLGSHVWDASIILASHLLHGTSPMDGDASFDVLELGAGIGLASLACLARHSHAEAWLTDMEDVINDATAPMLTTAPGSLSKRAHAETLEWSLEPVLPTWLTERQRPLLILAADVVYNEGQLPALARTMAVCLRARSRSKGLLAYRPRRDTRPFFEMLAKEGVTANRVAGAEYLDVEAYELARFEGDTTMHAS